MAQARPTLVTVICIYEALVGVAYLGGEIFSQFLRYAVGPGAHRLYLNPLHTGVVLFSAILSFGIASTLWWLRREAFFLSIVKVLLGLFSLVSTLYVFTNPRYHVPSISSGNAAAIVAFWVPQFIAAGFLLLGIAITVYIYRATFLRSAVPISSGTTGEYIP
jgi:hypothetical protein